MAFDCADGLDPSLSHRALAHAAMVCALTYRRGRMGWPD